jgi:hypothetical protein
MFLKYGPQGLGSPFKKTRSRMGADKHHGPVGAQLLGCGLNRNRVWS